MRIKDKDNKCSNWKQPPDSLPKKPTGTLRAFRSLEEFFDFFKSIDILNKPIPNNGYQTYANIMDIAINDAKSYITNRRIDKLGEPLPSSYEDAMERRTYQKMNDFNEVYQNHIKPRIQEILRESSAALELPTIKYNELGLGTFDFNKASGGLMPLYKYYSFEKKELVEGSDVETYLDNEVYKYKLKSDGTPVVLVPQLKKGYDKDLVDKAYKDILDGENVFDVLKKYDLKIGGSGAFSSSIKKCYLLKEKVKKPKNAVRIYVKIGAASGVTAEQYKFTGYLAVGIAELLSIMGYSVNIIAVFGLSGNDWDDSNVPRRFFGINLKQFTDTMDKSSLLYTVSDMTFFRTRCFSDVLVKMMQFYDDYVGSNLGYPLPNNEMENMIYNEYGKRDGYYNGKGQLDPKSQFLYYIIGEVKSQDELNQKILDIGLDVVNKNKLAREKLLGL